MVRQFLGNVQYIGAFCRHQCPPCAVDIFDACLRAAHRGQCCVHGDWRLCRDAAHTRYRVPFLCAILGGVLLPALVALAIGRPTLRLSGVYLAMATLAFGEVVRIVILNAETLTGGALGLNGIPQLTGWYDVALAVSVTLYVLLRLAHSRVGRTMTAISQDEVATELMGLNVRAYKLFSFVLGAALAGLAGGLNAHFTHFISPNEYGFERGVEILAMGVLGGAASPWGALIGAVVITLLPELLRGLGHYRPLLNGVILIVIILYSPKGIWDILQSVTRRAPQPPPASRC